jgi:hypothetical protein
MYYMTVDELKAIMPSVFTSNELLGIGWGDYTPEDLEAILGRSEVFIDDLKYKGHYKEEFQQHKFPRVLGTGYVVEKDDERIKKALCCVVYDFLKVLSTGDTRADLIRQGVKSISTGGVSESYGSLSDIKEVSTNYVKYLGFCLFRGVL